MSRLSLKVPSCVNVVGSLRTPDNPHNLDEDMLSIELPTGVFVTVGWSPECDPSGQYQLHVCEQTFDHQIEPPLFSKDYRVIENAIYKMLWKYLSSVSLVGAPAADARASVNGKVEYNPPAPLTLSSTADFRSAVYIA